MIRAQKWIDTRTGEVVERFNFLDAEYMEEVNEPIPANDTREKDLVVYEKGETHLKTMLYDDGRCVYTEGERYDLDDKRVMSFSEASDLIDVELAKKYDKPFKEIKEDEYHYYLEVLPPVKWITDDDSSSFFLSERDEGVYTLFCIRYKGKFYSAKRDITKKNQDLKSELQKQLGEAE